MQEYDSWPITWTLKRREATFGLDENRARRQIWVRLQQVALQFGPSSRDACSHLNCLFNIG